MNKLFPIVLALLFFSCDESTEDKKTSGEKFLEAQWKLEAERITKHLEKAGNNMKKWGPEDKAVFIQDCMYRKIPSDIILYRSYIGEVENSFAKKNIFCDCILMQGTMPRFGPRKKVPYEEIHKNRISMCLSDAVRE